MTVMLLLRWCEDSKILFFSVRPTEKFQHLFWEPPTNAGDVISRGNTFTPQTETAVRSSLSTISFPSIIHCVFTRGLPFGPQRAACFLNFTTQARTEAAGLCLHPIQTNGCV